MKTFRMIGLAIATMLICPMMTSCGGDDDDKEPGTGGGNGTSTDFGGNYLTEVGGIYNFGYDNQGRCNKIWYASSVFTIDYKTGKIYYQDSEDSETANVKFNNNGSISEYSESYSENGGSYSYSGSNKATYNYDKEGHILSIKVTSKESGKEDGYSYSYSAEGKMTFTWQSGNLTSGKGVVNFVEDGEKGTQTTEFSVRYSNTDNVFNQYTLSLNLGAGLSFDDIPVAMIGFFGKGPAKLPNYISTVEVDEDGEVYDSSYTVDATLNADGTISSETINGQRLSYSYGPASKSMSVEQNAISIARKSIFDMVKRKKQH